jgi:hypothetical protein
LECILSKVSRQQLLSTQPWVLPKPSQLNTERGSIVKKDEPIAKQLENLETNEQNEKEPNEQSELSNEQLNGISGGLAIKSKLTGGGTQTEDEVYVG